MAAKVLRSLRALNFEEALATLSEERVDFTKPVDGSVPLLPAAVRTLMYHCEGPQIFTKLLQQAGERANHTLLMTDSEGRGILHKFMQVPPPKDGNEPILLALLADLRRRGVPLEDDFRGKTPLHALACVDCSAEVAFRRVEALLAGLPPKERVTALDARTRSRETPLLLGALQHNYGPCVAFVRAGASVAARTGEGDDVLCLAVKTDHLELVHWFCGQLFEGNFPFPPMLPGDTRDPQKIYAFQDYQQLLPRLQKFKNTLSLPCVFYFDLCFNTAILEHHSEDVWPALPFKEHRHRALALMVAVQDTMARPLLPMLARYFFPERYAELAAEFVQQHLVPPPVTLKMSRHSPDP